MFNPRTFQSIASRYNVKVIPAYRTILNITELLLLLLVVVVVVVVESHSTLKYYYVICIQMLCCSVGIQIYTYFTLSFVLGVKLLLSLVLISALPSALYFW